MAGALRPAVLLIVLASLLFIVTGLLDSSSAFEGCRLEPTSAPCQAVAVSSLESWIFGAVNLIVALLIARGHERILALRIGLAAFFMVERPVTAVALGPKPVESVALHFVTAVVEAVILATTMRIWRLGHSVGQSDLAFLSLPAASPPLATAAAAAADAPPAAGPIVMPRPVAPSEGKKDHERLATPERPVDAAARRVRWTIGLVALLLTAALVADAVVSGLVPGADIDLASPAWLVYVFALVALAVAARAVHGGRFAVGLLLAVSLLVFVERAFTPFALAVTDPASLGLHAAAAVLALGLALVCAASLRGTRSRRSGPALPL